jgi:hypothetical protein
MPVFDSLVARGDAAPFIPEDAVNELFRSASEKSVFMSLARQLRAMNTSEMKLKVLSALPTIYFVGERGRSAGDNTFGTLKQTTEMAWANKFVYAEEMAVLVPIPNNLLADAENDLWEEIKPDIEGALAAKIDVATFFGTSGVDVPSLWPSGIYMQMPVSHKIGLNTPGDLYDHIMGEGGVISVVEEDGYFVNGHVAALGMRAKLRGLRDSTTGQPLFRSDMQGATQYSLDGEPMFFPRNGMFAATDVLDICGDWSQAVYSIRQDVNFEIFDTGVITDAAGVITHNLLQEDESALRVTFRMGWQLPNPINAVNPNAATRFPFASLETSLA